MASIKKQQGARGLSYKITVSAGRDAQEYQIRHYKTWKPPDGMTEKQADKEVKKIAYEFEAEVKAGFAPDNRATFAEYAAYVYSLAEQKGDKPQTLARWQTQLKRINGYIGTMKVTAIKPQHLNNLYKTWSKQGASRWRVYAAPVVDFRELVGGRTYAQFAVLCGVYARLICRLCNNQYISLEHAKTIETHLKRKDLFTIVGNDKPLSPRTIRCYHGIIYTVLEQAKKEMIIKYNPAERVTLPPKRNVRESRSLQPDELRGVLAAADNEPEDAQLMIYLFAVTGCRRGEIMGLRWSKIDFERGEMLVDVSLNYLKDVGIYEGSTKTENARYIALPRKVLEMLKEHKARQEILKEAVAEDWRENDLVFTRDNGTPFNPAHANYIFNRLCTANGFDHINPHMMRHSAASLLLSKGVDVLTVSNMLGHADPTTTLETYAHEIAENRRKAAQCIADSLLNV